MPARQAQKDKIIERKRKEQKINYACQVSKVFRLEITEQRRGGEWKGCQTGTKESMQ